MGYYVEVSDRKEFINKLKNMGFRIGHDWDEGKILNTGLPIIVDFSSKTIRLLNGTCSMWARVHGLIRKEEEFWNISQKDYKKIQNKILISIPHSSTKLSDIFKERLLISEEELQEQLAILTDYYADEIFDNPKCIDLKCQYSRLVCDTERFKNDENEVMSKIGMGAVYTKTTDGKDLIKLDEAYKNKIIEAVYDVHHALLDYFAERIIEERGECIIIDGHSFSEKWAKMLGNKAPYPDICIGYDKDFYDEKHVELFKQLANKYGYNCMENYPFAGSMVPNNFYKTKDSRVKSIMIELNKKIYINEETGEKTKGFEKVKKLMEEYVDELYKIGG